MELVIIDAIKVLFLEIIEGIRVIERLFGRGLLMIGFHLLLFVIIAVLIVALFAIIEAFIISSFVLLEISVAIVGLFAFYEGIRAFGKRLEKH